MRCVRCGGTIAGVASRCPGCGHGVGLGVLTPPPAGGTRPGPDPPDEEGTVVLAPGDSPTILPGAAVPTPLPDSDRTILSGSDQSILSADDQQTILSGHARPPFRPPDDQETGTFSSTPSPETRRPKPAARMGPRADEGPLAVGQAFGPRYHVIRLLGAGGMGAVYQAWDAELGEAVAIKVIRPEITADPQTAADVARRFKRELVLARQVTHKNVVRIHDLGEIDGIKYITMPYVEGDDLATVIKKHDKLPVGRALRITRSIVSGLVAAHAAGVVHRDLKPANIMIDANEDALIMDFGIARSTGAPVGGRVPGAHTIVDNLRQVAASPRDATVLGAVVGTVEYMAPEQAKGVAVDQRADVYALGLILYDMLVGRPRAAAAGNAIAELQGRLVKAPPAVKSLVPEVPDALDRLVSRCLEPDPDKRFAGTAELAAELNRLDDNGEAIRFRKVVGLPIVMVVVSLAIVLLGTTWYFAQQSGTPQEQAPVSVLIADFRNDTGDRVFEGALEQALTIGIEGASFVTAYQRPAALRVLTQQKAGDRLDEAGARLVSLREGIKVILAGSIAPSGSGYRLEVKAIDPNDGKVIATADERTSGKGDVLAAIGSIAEDLRDELGDTASGEEMTGAKETLTATSLDAIREYSIAQDLGLAGKDEEAIQHYKSAIGHDQAFGRAYSGWAVTAFRMGRRDEAVAAYEKALSLVDRMTPREKYRTFGTYYVSIDRNYDQAIKTYQDLLKDYPADSTGHNGLANAYFNTLKFAGALDEVRKALAIYPKSVLYRNNVALFAMYAGDFDTAAKEARTVIEQEPGYHKAYLALAMSALAANDTAAARDAYGRMQGVSARGASLAKLGLADLAIYEGQYQTAERELQDGLAEDQKTKNVAGVASKSIALAEVHHVLGRTRQAVDRVAAALAVSRDDQVLVAAGELLIQAGRLADARSIAKELSGKFQPQSRAYAGILEGQIALKEGRIPAAVTAFQGARELADLWLANYMLGVAYVQTNHHAAALEELEKSGKRRGEATAVFLDDMPTFRRLATLPYYLGRAQEGLRMKAAAVENYNAYLKLRANAPADLLAADARKRVGGR